MTLLLSVVLGSVVGLSLGLVSEGLTFTLVATGAGVAAGAAVCAEADAAQQRLAGNGVEAALVRVER